MTSYGQAAELMEKTMYGGIFVKKFTMSTNSKIAENKEYNCRDALKTDTVDFMIFLLKLKNDQMCTYSK